MSVALAVAGAAPAFAQSAKSDDPSFLVIHGGAYNVLRSDEVEGEMGVEWRGHQKLWIFKPHAGAMVNGDGSWYLEAGPLVDVYFGRRVVITLSTAAGYFNRGDGNDLGDQELLFRSGVELGYRFDNRSRLGVGFYHMSNANLDDKNPGSESAIVYYAWPLGGGKSGTQSAALPAGSYYDPKTKYDFTGRPIGR